MKNAFYFPVNHNATFGERLTVLRESVQIKSVQKLAEEIFYQLDKYQKTNEPETDSATIEGIRKRIASHLKNNCNPKMEFIKEYCDFFHCDADFLLGYIDFPNKQTQSIYDIVGLNKKAVENLIFLNNNNGRTQAGHNETETLNLLLSDLQATLHFLGGLQDFLNVRYKIPVYHTGNHTIVDNYTDNLHQTPIDGVSVPECIVPDNDYDIIRGSFGFKDVYTLTLAQDREKPYDNYQISLTDDFLESVALITIEKAIISLRNNLNEKE